MKSDFEQFANKNTEMIRLAENLKQPSQVPVLIPAYGQVFTRIGEVKMGEYYKDPEVMLNCQLACRKRFWNLTSVFPDFYVAHDLATMFGCQIVWPENDTPWVIPKITDIHQVKNMKVPDPYHDGLMPARLATYRYMRAEAGNICDVGGTLGPFDLAGLLRGQTAWFMDLVKNPEFAHQLLHICTETLIETWKAMERFAGNLERIALGDDGPGYVSRRHFQDFHVPYIRRVFDAFPEAKHWWHCDGSLKGKVDLIPLCGADVLSIFDPNIDIGLVKKAIGDKVCLIGNLHPIQVLREKDPETVQLESRRIMDKAASGGGFVLAAGGEISGDTPLRNIEAMIEAVIRWGKY